MSIYNIIVGVIKIESIVLRVGIKPTSLAFQASVLPFHHVGSLMSPLYPRPPIYAAPCLRGQCKLLQYIYKQYHIIHMSLLLNRYLFGSLIFFKYF